MSSRYYRIPSLHGWRQKNSEEPTCVCEACTALEVDTSIIYHLKADTRYFTFRHMVDVCYSLQGGAGFDSRFTDPITDVMLGEVETLNDNKIRAMLRTHSAIELVNRGHFLIDCFTADPLAKQTSISRLNDALAPYLQK
jgi:hypothetical protein